MGVIVRMADVFETITLDPDIHSFGDSINMAAATGKAFVLSQTDDGDKILLQVADIRTATETDD